MQVLDLEEVSIPLLDGVPVSCQPFYIAGYKLCL
jgi:hypothetical protein